MTSTNENHAGNVTFTDAPTVLVVACGALASEIRDIANLHQLKNVDVVCLPAILHNRPEQIAPALRQKLRSYRKYDRILIGYADCGSGGEIKKICENLGGAQDVTMLPGDHCYQFYSGHEHFATMHHNDPTAFYLTDYLTKHFDRIIMAGLGINDHPELLDIYFGNYTKLIYLAQTQDVRLDHKAQAAAKKLGLRYERIEVGYGELETALLQVTRKELVPA